MSDRYLNILKDGLEKRQSKNPRYSLRSYAKDLGINSSTLSQVLRNKRKLPEKYVEQIIDKLRLDSPTKEAFLQSYDLSNSFLDKIDLGIIDRKIQLEDTQYALIAEWEYFTILQMFDLTNFKFETANIAKRLNITEQRVSEVLSGLSDAGLIEKNSDHSYAKKYDHVKTRDEIASKALTESHHQTLEMAKEKLELKLSERDYSSLVFAMDKSKIELAKRIIREFRLKMTELCKDGNKTEVYQLAIQLFPMTEVDKNE